jgi:hypothetical protein
MSILTSIRARLIPPPKPDAYVVSYPKSGRTWLRALIGKYFADQNRLPQQSMFNTKFLKLDTGVPFSRLCFTHAGSEMKREVSYQNFSVNLRDFADKRVTLLGRDIKDTIVSAYFQAHKRLGVFDGSISNFIRTDEFGVRKILSFYSAWLENIEKIDDLLLIMYEELHADTAGTLRRVLHFLGESTIHEASLASSVAFSSFQNLKKVEGENRFGHSRLHVADGEDPESYKVRKGKVGGFSQYLSEEDIKYIDGVISSIGFSFADFRGPS